MLSHHRHFVLSVQILYCSCRLPSAPRLLLLAVPHRCRVPFPGSAGCVVCAKASRCRITSTQGATIFAESTGTCAENGASVIRDSLLGRTIEDRDIIGLALWARVPRYISHLQLRNLKLCHISLPSILRCLLSVPAMNFPSCASTFAVAGDGNGLEGRVGSVSGRWRPGGAARRTGM